MHAVFPTVVVSCDDEAYVDRRHMPAARHTLDACYSAALYHAGALSWVLPHPRVPNVDAAFLARLALARGAGLLLTGGDFDVPPQDYGQAPSPKLGRLNYARSSFEAALFVEAQRLGMPVFGVCGGMQLINVQRGGTLYQDLSLRPGTQVHVQPMDRAQPFHALHLRANTLLCNALGEQSCAVNSTHHQIVDALGQGLLACAHAPDGVIEAIEQAPKDGASWLLGVQWHPEAMREDKQQRLYHAFVQACITYLARKTSPQ